MVVETLLFDKDDDNALDFFIAALDLYSAVYYLHSAQDVLRSGQWV